MVRHPPDHHGAWWALARVEGRRLVRHPLFGLGCAISTLILGILHGGRRTSTETCWAPRCFLAAQRERRDGASDLYRASALPTRTPTAAMLLSPLWAAAATSGLFAAAWLASIGPDGTIAVDGRSLRPGAFELAQPPLVVIALCALGITLGRWLPSAGVGPPLVLVAACAASVSALPWVVQRQIEHPSDGLHGQGGWNLAFLAGLTLAASAAALSRDDRSRAMTLLGALGLAIAAAGYVLGAPYTGGR